MNDLLTPFSLSGKVALVTGASSGFGCHFATVLAQAGARVALAARRTDRIREEAEKINAAGGEAIAITMDVTNSDSVSAGLDEIQRTLGVVNVVINNAGITIPKLLLDLSDDDWNNVIDTNLNGIYRTIKLCLPGMIERKWGRIINIASTAASVGSPEYAAYCASKAAVVGLTRCVALEGAAHGVSCNAISPGWVETENVKSELKKLAFTFGKSPAEYIEEIKQINPQKRIIQPDEIAAFALFLCRDEAKAINMQDLTVSGGALW